MKQIEKDFWELMQKHKGILLKISRMYCKDSDDQEDLQQEMLAHLWKAFQSFKEESKFSTWMYRVCLNVAITAIRKSKRQPSFESLEKHHDVAEISSNYVEKENRLNIFYKATQELNRIEKALLFLFMEGQSHKEIANQLGISEVNARVKLNRSKKKLQEIIKNKGYEF